MPGKSTCTDSVEFFDISKMKYIYSVQSCVYLICYKKSFDQFSCIY